MVPKKWVLIHGFTILSNVATTARWRPVLVACLCDRVAAGCAGNGKSPVTVPFATSNVYWFACKVSGHCQAGQKLEVTVNPPGMGDNRMCMLSAITNVLP